MRLIFNRKKHKRKILLLIGGLLTMTMLTGCFGKSNKEIADHFNDITTIFPTEDLTDFYDKETDKENYFPYDNLGTWEVSCYQNTKNEEGKIKTGGLLSFNRDTRQAKGNFILKKVENGKNIESKYPIYYDEDGIHFVDENIDESLKEELSNFKLPYNFIALNREYLDSLKEKEFTYTGQVPMYGAKYKLPSEDINVKKIKDMYPELAIDTNNIFLEFEGVVNLWKNSSYLSLTLYLDVQHDNYFTFYITLNKSDIKSN